MGQKAKPDFDASMGSFDDAECCDARGMIIRLYPVNGVTKRQFTNPSPAEDQRQRAEE